MTEGQFLYAMSVGLVIGSMLGAIAMLVIAMRRGWFR
jgi:gas vesicle protein